MRPTAQDGTVYLCRQPVDFRKSISGLSLIVEQALGLDPFGEAVYVFTNRQRNRVKILCWEKNGFVLWYKRLEKHHFCWPRQLSAGTVTLSAQELNWLLDGFDIWRHPPHQPLHYQSVS
jgi:transposase